MYSRLNVLVNEINALGVKDITDLNINRKILQSLRKPAYDLVKGNHLREEARRFEAISYLEQDHVT
jgi:hypothetical protein